MIAFVFILFVILICISYIVYRFLVSNLKGVDIQKGVVHCKKGAKTVSGSKLPSFTNGHEWGISFWVYMEQADPTMTNKHVLSIGTDTAESTFMVVMDRNINRMYLIFKTAQSAGVDALDALQTFKQNTRPTSHVIVPLEFVPLSRWTHVTAVVDQDTIMFYQDGGLSAIVSASRFMTGAILAQPSGDIAIGSVSNGANAYTSNIKVFNYSLSSYQVKSMYKAGPGTWGILAGLGVSKYKLQWPIKSAV